MANGGYSSPFSETIAVQRLAFVSRSEALGIAEGLRARRVSAKDEVSWPSSSHPTLGRLSEVTSRMLPEICRLATACADSAGAPEELVLVFLWLSLYRVSLMEGAEAGHAHQARPAARWTSAWIPSSA